MVTRSGGISNLLLVIGSFPHVNHEEALLAGELYVHLLNTVFLAEGIPSATEWEGQ
jgi:hypothetical protein